MSTVQPEVETPRHDPLRPSVSRLVHYVANDHTCLAALVVAVDADGYPTLRVYSDEDPTKDRIVVGSMFEQEIEDEEPRSPGSWHWPVAW